MEGKAFLHISVSPRLKELVQERARGNRRSITQEINVALERYVAPATNGATASAEQNFESHTAPR